MRRWIDNPLRMIPYLALLGSVLLALLVPEATRSMPAVLAVAALTALWIYWLVTRHSQWQRRTALMAVFFAVLVLLIATLIFLNPLFGFFAWTGYLFTMYALRGWWRIAGAATIGVLTASSQVGGFAGLFGPDPVGLPIFAVVLLFNISIAGAMTYLSIRSDDETARRAQMLADLAEANAKLEAALAENAGLHAQLLFQAREAGILDERQRMAGEIHDVLAQGLTGIVTQLEAADAAAGRPADHARHLAQAKRLARDGLSEARRSVHALRPQPLEDAALPQALAEVVGDWSALTEVNAELITTGTAQPLLPEIETTLLRTAQEALANVAKHAGASRVALTLSYMEDLVSLDVRDDGSGFDPAAPSPGSYGLPTMRDRVHRMAGTLAVESEPGGGTAVSASVPAVAA